MAPFRVRVVLYGSLSRLGGGRHIAELDVKLEPGSCKSDLMSHLGIADDEKGYVFINAVLCDVPGLTTGGEEELHDGDHVGIFSIDRMWPYQYRDGVRMSKSLEKALREHGAMHNIYNISGEHKPG